mgnify:CR=1 FL=1
MELMERIWDTMRAGRDALTAWGSAASGIVVRFVAEATRCAVCGEALKSYKTTEAREVASVRYGRFRAVEAQRYCPRHAPGTSGKGPGATGPSGKIYRSEALASLVGPKRKYAYDAIAHVGRRYFLDSRNEREIRSELAGGSPGLAVPSRSVDRLVEEYVAFLAAAHEASSDRLRELLAANGGYVLCVDGTCGGRAPVHLACMDSVSRILLASFKIGGENAVEVRRCLERVEAVFGKPRATMGDMRRPLRRVREQMWGDIAHFVCHTHFVADAGRDILGPPHDRLGGLLRRSKLNPSLIAMRQYLGQRLRAALAEEPLRLERLLRAAEGAGGASLQEAVHAVLAQEARAASRSGESPLLAQLDREQLCLAIAWAQAYASEGRGQGFPFDLPKLACYRRCARLYDQLGAWIDHAPARSRQTGHFRKFRELLAPIVHGPDFAEAVQDLEGANRDFTRLRDLLRVFPADGPAGLAGDDAFPSAAEAAACERRARDFRDELRRRLDPGSGATERQQRVARHLVQQLDAYWSGLFGHALVDDGGGLLLVERTNNAEERLHRFTKRARRRVHGRSSVLRDLQRWRPEFALAYNLTLPQYVHAVYGSLDDMPKRFAEVAHRLPDLLHPDRSPEVLIRPTPLQRKQPDFPDRITAIRKALALAERRPHSNSKDQT